MDSKLTTTSTTAVQMPTVDDEVEHELVAEFVYDPADALAITLVLQTASGPVHWTFARELLVEGQYEPVGDGDVHVWPCLSGTGEAVVIFEFSSPDGEVLVQASLRECTRFVARMLDSVPHGQEEQYLDIDAAITELLGEASEWSDDAV